ncbi:MAG: ATP-dependent Clp protease proteolytic subunit [Chlamydiota bacterium]
MPVIPYVIEDTGRGERSMDIYSRLLKDRIVFIGTEINDQVANAVVAQLIFLKAEDPKKDISIYINSPGGIISAGLAIYDTMHFLGVDINTYCIGQAASLSALILCAGTKGKRFALPHSRMMIHQPLGGITGSSADIHIQANEILNLKRILSEIIAKHTGQPLEKVIKDSERDFYMSPEDAVAYGLIDEMLLPASKLVQV